VGTRRLDSPSGVTSIARADQAEFDIFELGQPHSTHDTVGPRADRQLCAVTSPTWNRTERHIEERLPLAGLTPSVVFVPCHVV
jgi:hypothetical protein